MPITSRWKIEIPQLSLPSLLFTSPTHTLPDVDIFFDAENPTRKLSLDSFRLWSQRFAAGLRRSGLQDGDRVLLFSHNDIFFPVVFMGVIMAGGIFTGANPSYVATELAYQLRISEPRFLLCAPGSLDIGLEAASQASLSRDQVFVFETIPARGAPGQSRSDCSHWSTLLASVAAGKAFRWDELSAQEQRQRTIVLNSSSGTTGLPKCVEITHHGYVATTLLMEHFNDLPPDCPFRKGMERYLCFLPLYHAMGQTIFMSLALRRQIPVYIMPHFNFTKMLDYIQGFRITKLVVVPSILVALAKDLRVRRGDWDLSSVWQISSGAAPLAKSVIQEVQENWEGDQGVRITQGYGMTELTCGAIFSLPPFPPNLSPATKSLPPEAPPPPMDALSSLSTASSVGELVANCEGKLMNDAGTAEVPRGMRGELWIRGPIVMKGYWRNPAATREVMTDDGWLITGDICYVDIDGNFHIVDRKKASFPRIISICTSPSLVIFFCTFHILHELFPPHTEQSSQKPCTNSLSPLVNPQDLIKVSAHQVAPAELEALLLTHPAILEAAVVGILSTNGTEQPRAFVVRREVVPGNGPHADTNPGTTPNPSATGNRDHVSDADSPLAQEIETWVAARVHKTKRLTGGVRFVAGLPKGSTGKVIRRALREWRGSEGEAKL